MLRIHVRRWNSASASGDAHSQSGGIVDELLLACVVLALVLAWPAKSANGQTVENLPALTAPALVNR